MSTPIDFPTYIRLSSTTYGYLHQTKVWHSERGPIAVADLELSHAEKILVFMERRAKSYHQRCIDGAFWSTLGPGMDDGIMNSIDEEIEHIEQTKALDYVRSTPLYKAIAEHLHDGTRRKFLVGL